MPFRGPLDYLPLWGVFVVTIVLVMVAIQSGLWVGRRKGRHSEEAPKIPGEIPPALLGLLALLLAFTFSLAASRFDTRRGLVLDEANAIGTTWLRAGLLPEPHRTEIRKLLRAYLEVRLLAVQSGRAQEGIAGSEELHGRLWAEVEALGKQQPGSIMAGLFIASLNQVIDLHATRVMFSLRTRIPLSIWAALYGVTLLAMGAIGYHAGLTGARGFIGSVPLVLALSTVMWLIADLDRPHAGLLKVSQQPLIDLRKTMDAPGS